MEAEEGSLWSLTGRMNVKREYSHMTGQGYGLSTPQGPRCPTNSSWDCEGFVAGGVVVMGSGVDKMYDIAYDASPITRLGTTFFCH